jgi:hypothetical protein
MNNGDDKRKEKRINQKTTVYVEVAAAEFDNSSPAKVIMCSSLDMSASGLQVEMDQEVEVGCILRLCAEFSDDDKTLYLVGETMWVKAVDDHFKIGFQLYDAENTDIDSWKNLMATKLNP